MVEKDNKERMVTLVRQAKLGDASSFAKLYEMICQDLYRTALYRLGNPEDAENVVGDTVLDAYAGIGRLKDETAFKAWIFRILYNKCNRMIKSYMTRRDIETAQSVDEMAETLATTQNDIENAEAKTMIRDAFSVLSDEEKQIVTMTIYGEYDSGEISRLLGMNRNTVRSKYSRALVKMRDRLSGQSIYSGLR